MELGAGIGFVGAVIALHAKPKRVVSFEANPDIINTTNTLYKANGLQDRISVRNQIVIANPGRPETVPFHVSHSYCSSSLYPIKSGVNKVDVPTVSYDSVQEDFSPTVLVCDIEGAELDLLEHADLTGLRAIVIEFHPNRYGIKGMDRCKSILRAAGFAENPELSTQTVWICERTET